MSEIYAFNINDILTDNDLKYLKEQNSPIRRQRSQCYYFLDDVKRSLASGAILNYYCKIQQFNKERCTVDWNKFGKPYWVNGEDSFFNISHSGQWVVCGFDKNEIGIDIEKIVNLDVELIAEQLADSEYKYIMQKTGFERTKRLMSIWTLKESYIKYLGQGLSVPLKSFSVYVDNLHSNKENEVNYQYENVWLKQRIFFEDYYLSECSHDCSSMKIKILSMDDIRKIND